MTLLHTKLFADSQKYGLPSSCGGHDSPVESLEAIKAAFLNEHFNERKYCMFCGTPIIVGSRDGIIMEQFPVIMGDDSVVMGIACRDIYECNARIKIANNARVPLRAGHRRF